MSCLFLKQRVGRILRQSLITWHDSAYIGSPGFVYCPLLYQLPWKLEIFHARVALSPWWPNHGLCATCSSPDIGQSPAHFSPWWLQETVQPGTSHRSGFPRREHAPSPPSSLFSLWDCQLRLQAAGAGAAAVPLTPGCAPHGESQSGSAVRRGGVCSPPLRDTQHLPLPPLSGSWMSVEDQTCLPEWVTLVTPALGL